MCLNGKLTNFKCCLLSTVSWRSLPELYTALLLFPVSLHLLVNVLESWCSYLKWAECTATCDVWSVSSRHKVIFLCFSIVDKYLGMYCVSETFSCWLLWTCQIPAVLLWRLYMYSTKRGKKPHYPAVAACCSKLRRNTSNSLSFIFFALSQI